MTRSLRLPCLSLALLAVPALPACSSGQASPTPTPEAVREAAATITAEDVHRRIGVLAHDSMRGRQTPSPELDEAAEWIAGEFRRLGLEPAGDDGGYVQRYPIRRMAVDLERSEATLDGRRLRFGEDVMPSVLQALPPLEALAGEVVVVSGTADPQDGLEGADLAGRMVVLVPPAGAAVTRDRAALAVAREILARGPAAILVAADAAEGLWSAAAAAHRERAFTVVGDADDGLALFDVRDEALAPILARHGIDLAGLRRRAAEGVRVRPLDGVEGTVEAAPTVHRERWAPNVAGVLRGGDPALAGEYLVYSAHMDHVGVGAPDASGDSIYNGADDDASGTAAVLEVAQAFASMDTPPRRSVIFLAVSGEEHGLWGSEYFAEHPPVPVESLVANLNVDMIGRNWSDTVVAIGKEHSDLGETLAEVQARHPELGMTAIDDLWPEENFYGRSDHYNFARRGVPVLFFFSGTHEDYHRPSDELHLVDTEKTARIARLLFYLGVEVANAAEPPHWDAESRARIVDGG